MNKILKPFIDKVFKLGDKEVYIYKHEGKYFVSPVNNLVIVDDGVPMYKYL